MSHAGPTRRATDAERRDRPRAVDASMGLLNDLMHHPVDPGYAEAAARPPAGTGPGARSATGLLHLLLAVLLGAATVVAITTLRSPEPAAREGRDLLQSQVLERSAQADGMQQQVSELSEEIATLQSDALETAAPGLFAELSETEVISGAVEVEGDGVVLVLDDPDDDIADGDPRARVQDVDLQVVTNALWAAGAEAMAINGQRLTALSAIRSAGPAILVDLAPLVAPYRVEAIGDAGQMQTGFARSPAANHLTMLSGTYGIETSFRAEPDLVLPGSGTPTLRYATVPEESGPAAGDDGTMAVPDDEEGTP